MTIAPIYRRRPGRLEGGSIFWNKLKLVLRSEGLQPVGVEGVEAEENMYVGLNKVCGNGHTMAY